MLREPDPCVPLTPPSPSVSFCLSLSAPRLPHFFASQALPIFLGNLVPSWLAVILSVSLVLFFGEIFPSAVFTGKNQLAIAAGMSWLVYTLMMVLGPVAWPISWMLVGSRVRVERSLLRKTHAFL